MELTCAVRKVDTYEIRTPIGPKRVIVHTKTEEVKDHIPDEVANEVSDVPDFKDLDIIVEGVGIVLVDMQDGQRYPQPVQFRFPDSVQNRTDAFARFDECMRNEIKRRQEEDQKSQQTVQPANETDLEAINQASNITI